MFETATRFANGKRNPDQLKTDFKQAVQALADSTIPLEEITELFVTSGFPFPQQLIQNIAARRNAVSTTGTPYGGHTL